MGDSGNWLRQAAALAGNVAARLAPIAFNSNTTGLDYACQPAFFLRAVAHIK
jgi:hypothetical protein